MISTTFSSHWQRWIFDSFFFITRRWTLRPIILSFKNTTTYSVFFIVFIFTCFRVYTIFFTESP
jgi:uncharacterized membrane protein YqhA